MLNVLHPTSSVCELCTPRVCNVIYHKFSHGDTSIRSNGKTFFLPLRQILFFSILAVLENSVLPLG